jgi:hypothetical protein
MYVIDSGAGCWNVRWNSTSPGETIQSYPCGWAYMGPEWFRWVEMAPNEIFQFVYQYSTTDGDLYVIHPLGNLSLCLAPRPIVEPIPGKDSRYMWNIEQTTCDTSWHRYTQLWVVTRSGPLAVGDQVRFRFRSLMDGPYSTSSRISQSGAHNRLLIDGNAPGSSEGFTLRGPDTGGVYYR